VTVSGIVHNHKGEILLCKMPEGRGAYPGQWAIPGGGIDEGEQMRETLVREMGEEVGLKVAELEPFAFEDAVRDKISRDGSAERLYMIHLVFDCKVVSGELKMNDEFEEYAWVMPEKLREYDLNEATIKTFTKKGWI
jgi:nucleoside triphosphatase